MAGLFETRPLKPFRRTTGLSQGQSFPQLEQYQRGRLFYNRAITPRTVEISGHRGLTPSSAPKFPNDPSAHRFHLGCTSPVRTCRMQSPLKRGVAKAAAFIPSSPISCCARRATGPRPESARSGSRVRFAQSARASSILPSVVQRCDGCASHRPSRFCRVACERVRCASYHPRQHEKLRRYTRHRVSSFRTTRDDRVDSRPAPGAGTDAAHARRPNGIS
jgi:hypothetical protein